MSVTNTLNSLKADNLLAGSYILTQIADLKTNVTVSSEGKQLNFDDYYDYLQKEVDKLPVIELLGRVPASQESNYTVQLIEALGEVQSRADFINNKVITLQTRLIEVENAIRDARGTFDAWYTLAVHEYLDETDLKLPVATIKALASSEFSRLMSGTVVAISTLLTALKAESSRIDSKKKMAKQKYDMGREQVNMSWASQLPGMVGHSSNPGSMRLLKESPDVELDEGDDAPPTFISKRQKVAATSAVPVVAELKAEEVEGFGILSEEACHTIAVEVAKKANALEEAMLSGRLIPVVMKEDNTVVRATEGIPQEEIIGLALIDIKPDISDEKPSLSQIASSMSETLQAISPVGMEDRCLTASDTEPLPKLSEMVLEKIVDVSPEDVEALRKAITETPSIMEMAQDETFAQIDTWQMAEVAAEATEVMAQKDMDMVYALGFSTPSDADVTVTCDLHMNVTGDYVLEATPETPTDELKPVETHGCVVGVDLGVGDDVTTVAIMDTATHEVLWTGNYKADETIDLSLVREAAHKHATEEEIAEVTPTGGFFKRGTPALVEEITPELALSTFDDSEDAGLIPEVREVPEEEDEDHLIAAEEAVIEAPIHRFPIAVVAVDEIDTGDELDDLLPKTVIAPEPVPVVEATVATPVTAKPNRRKPLSFSYSDDDI